jgi:Lar family restriction alleviation protein
MGHEERRVYQGRNSGMAGIEKQKRGNAQMKKTELKACPHCGGEKVRIENNGLSGYGMNEKPDYYWTICLTCFASGGPGKDRKEAAENWNHRIP